MITIKTLVRFCSIEKMQIIESIHNVTEKNKYITESNTSYKLQKLLEVGKTRYILWQ